MPLASLILTTLLMPSVQKDVVYRKVGETELKFDLYTPGPTVKSNGKLVIAVHGGAWISGDRSSMAGACQHLAEQGYTAATISYRLAPQDKWPAQIDDVQSAVRYFRANAQKYGIDKTRIGAIGASAGGHLVLLLGSTDTRDTKTDFFPKESSRVQAVINLFGPTDLSQDFGTFAANLLSKQVIGKEYNPKDPVILSFSPVNSIDSKTAPIFTIHGTADPVVPVKQTSRLDEALKKAGVPHELRLIEGMGHEINLEIEACQKAVAESLEWLGKQLKVK